MIRNIFLFCLFLSSVILSQNERNIARIGNENYEMELKSKSGKYTGKITRDTLEYKLSEIRSMLSKLCIPNYRHYITACSRS